MATYTITGTLTVARPLSLAMDRRVGWSMSDWVCKAVLGPVNIVHKHCQVYLAFVLSDPKHRTRVRKYPRMNPDRLCLGS